MPQLNQWATWTALITPFTEKGVVDLSSLELLLKRQEEAQNGVVLLGSTGEGLALDKATRRAVLNHACALDLSIPILVGVDGFRLQDVLAWMEECEELPIDGFMLVTPIYARPGKHGQLAWFKELLNASQKPCMLYNVPHRAGCDLHLDVICELKDHPNFWAIKEASGSIETFEMFCNEAPNLRLFSGNDDCIPDRAHGLVSVMGNIWPQEVNAYVKERSTQEVWKKAARLANQCNPVAAKRILYTKGIISSDYLKPPLSSKDGGDLSALSEVEEQLGIGRLKEVLQ